MSVLVDDLALAALERRAFDTRTIWQQLLESEGTVAALPPPIATGSTLRAIAASLVELLALRRDEPAPDWTKTVLPLDEPFLLVTGTSKAKLARLAQESPMPLLKRRLLAPEGFLTVA